MIRIMQIQSMCLIVKSRQPSYLSTAKNKLFNMKFKSFFKKTIISFNLFFQTKKEGSPRLKESQILKKYQILKESQRLKESQILKQSQILKESHPYDHVTICLLTWKFRLFFLKLSLKFKEQISKCKMKIYQNSNLQKEDDKVFTCYLPVSIRIWCSFNLTSSSLSLLSKLDEAFKIRRNNCSQ